MKPSETLRGARAVLVKHGWVQCMLGKKAWGFCAVGAISQALENDTVSANPHGFSEARRFLAQAINGDRYLGVVHWNDEAGRTKAEVLSAFAEAIKLAEEVGQ